MPIKWAQRTICVGLRVSRPIEVVVLNCWVTETKDNVSIKQLDELGKVRQGPGQAVDLIDNDHVDLAGPDIL